MKMGQKIAPLIALALLVFVTGCAPTVPPASTPAASTPAPEPSERSSPPAMIEGEISVGRNFYIIVDGSGSMRNSEYAGTFSTRIEAAKWAVTEFIKSAVPSDVNLGLYAFDSKGTFERVGLGKNNRDQIIAEIQKIRADNATPLNHAIKEATKALSKQRDKQLGYGEFYIVVATDGEATDGSEAREGVEYAIKNKIPIITIGFGLNKEHSLSKHSISYRNATSPEELLQALKETQAESPYFDSTVFEKK